MKLYPKLRTSHRQLFYLSKTKGYFPIENLATQDDRLGKKSKNQRSSKEANSGGAADINNSGGRIYLKGNYDLCSYRVFQSEEE